MLKKYFTSHSANPFIQTHHPYKGFNKNCLYCDRSICDIVKPISRVGTSQFLAHTFINGSNNSITPIQASKLLFEFHDVVKVVYGRNVSTAESNYVTQMTILVLLAANIIHLEIEEDTNPVAY